MGKLCAQRRYSCFNEFPINVGYECFFFAMQFTLFPCCFLPNYNKRALPSSAVVSRSAFRPSAFRALLLEKTKEERQDGQNGLLFAVRSKGGHTWRRGGSRRSLGGRTCYSFSSTRNDYATQLLLSVARRLQHLPKQFGPGPNKTYVILMNPIGS